MAHHGAGREAAARTRARLPREVGLPLAEGFVACARGQHGRADGMAMAA